MTKLHHFLKNQDQIETKNSRRTNLIFLSKNMNQKSNSKIFTQNSKNIIFTFFVIIKNNKIIIIVIIIIIKLNTNNFIILL